MGLVRNRLFVQARACQAHGGGELSADQALGIAQIGSRQVSAIELGHAQVGAAKITLSQRGAVQRGTAESGSPEIRMNRGCRRLAPRPCPSQRRLLAFGTEASAESYPASIISGMPLGLALLALVFGTIVFIQAKWTEQVIGFTTKSVDWRDAPMTQIGESDLLHGAAVATRPAALETLGLASSMASAVRITRSASLPGAAGAPNTAMTRSPMCLSLWPHGLRRCIHRLEEAAEQSVQNGEQGTRQHHDRSLHE
jgi:hypothetical protein